ncbi:MAG: MFS transporter [Bacillota bacterium]
MLLSEYDKPTPLHYKILGLTWAGWMFDFYDLILYSFLLVPIGRELHFSKLELSYILGLSLAATAVGGVIFGVLADRYGRKPVLLGTILTFSVGTFLCGIAGNFTELLIYRVICGLGVGGEWATGQSYVAETFPPRMRGRYGAYIQTGAPIGIALASVVGGFLEPAIGWRHCFFVSLFPALLVAAMIWVEIPESDLWLLRNRTRPGEESGSSAAVGAPVTEDVGLCSSITGTTHPIGWRGFLDLFVGPCSKMFYMALILALLDLSAYWFTYSWLPGYLQEQRGFSQARSAVWLLVTQAGGFFGYLTFGIVADSIGRRPAYSIYSVLWALGLLMATVLWDAVNGRADVILACMFLVGVGTGMFGGYGPLFAEIFPTAIRNTAMGAAFNLARGVQFFTPVIIALVAQRYGLAGGISLAAFFALATGAWVWMFPETRGRRLGGTQLVMAH